MWSTRKIGTINQIGNKFQTRAKTLPQKIRLPKPASYQPPHEFCPHCGSPLTKYIGMLRGNTRFKCELCNKTFYSRKDRERNCNNEQLRILSEALERGNFKNIGEFADVNSSLFA